SRRYDLANHLLSCGVHVLWKRAAVAAAALPPGGVGLDVCSGTGDLLVRMARVVGSTGRAIGVDFAPGMLEVAARRAAGERRSRVALICADAEALPVAGATCDALTISFGLRNVAQPQRALAEFHRVLRPGGRLVILEFSRPRCGAVRALYDLYMRTIIRHLGGWLSGRRDAYGYLRDSIQTWPGPDELAGLIRQAGFEDVRYRAYSAGIAVLHVAARPMASAGGLQ
ncbi:MAG: bifunctional demethylmenaquinone methyltransferase/2-methoxy-6-polyprenyl-1,4-benzoquinol methylase UbiE, partial [Chloroflexi bacterium]|nr:bifunctional demethylmenaquinone methyltransferase/2-methoxy-6-polyprenyl-1,4-benzoquinol methylase UbiE [Chloroflexota bacterium]